MSGVLGIKVKIMLPWDPTGKTGPKKPLPDHVSIVEPKEEVIPTTPVSEHKGGKPEQPAGPIMWFYKVHSHLVFFSFMQRRKKDSFKIILKFFYMYRPSTVKIIFLGWEETHFQKFTDVCYHRGFEFQMKLVIWKSMHPLTDASHSSHTVLTVVN